MLVLSEYRQILLRIAFHWSRKLVIEQSCRTGRNYIDASKIIIKAYLNIQIFANFFLHVHILINRILVLILRLAFVFTFHKDKHFIWFISFFAIFFIFALTFTFASLLWLFFVLFVLLIFLFPFWNYVAHVYDRSAAFRFVCRICRFELFYLCVRLLRNCFFWWLF